VIEKYCDNWRFDRLSAIDRAILRLAFHELSIKKTPAKVIINEAIGLAKKFSGDDAGSFVNGVLDAASKAQTQKKTASAESHAADAKRHKS
jgi:N utilization substance protein B